MRLVHCIVMISVGTGLGLSGASAQTKTPNTGQPKTLRSWPIAGSWATALVRTKDPGLACVMISGHGEAGLMHYGAALVQRPNILSLVISDRNPTSLVSQNIELNIDGVTAGLYPISKRDDSTENHSIRSDLPDSDTARIITLFRTGGNVKFITNAATYDFPLKGAEQALQNMAQCVTEMKNLEPSDKK